MIESSHSPKHTVIGLYVDGGLLCGSDNDGVGANHGGDSQDSADDGGRGACGACRGGGLATYHLADDPTQGREECTSQEVRELRRS